MTPTNCPKCGALREQRHQFCPSCGFDYRTLGGDVAKATPEPKGNRRRDVIILAVVVVATAVIYNLVAPVVGSDKPKPPATPADAPLILQNIVQEGHRLMDSGQFENAIVKYQQALAIDSLQPDIMVDLGACLHAVGENARANLQFLRALAISPRHPVALFNLGVVSLTVADTAAAKKWWNRYLEVATDVEQIRQVREQLSKM